MMLDFLVEERTGLTGAVEEFTLAWPVPHITVRELVNLKVREELKRLQSRGEVKTLSVSARLDPQSAERLVQDKCQRAIDAMTTNAIFVFLGDRQITDLDEEIRHDPETKIEFIHLIPLKGG